MRDHRSGRGVDRRLETTGVIIGDAGAGNGEMDIG